MARIRTIKPEFPQSESVGRISRDARLLFIEIWTICDDFGKARASSRMLASLLFPYDDDAPKLIDGWLSELERERCIQRYEVDGTHYLRVEKWQSHQKVDHPSKSLFPDPREIVASPREKLGEDLRTKDQGSKDQDSEANASGANAPQDLKLIIFGQGLDWLANQSGKPKEKLRSALGRACRDHGEATVIEVLGAAQREGPIDPIAWMERAFKLRKEQIPSQRSSWQM